MLCYLGHFDCSLSSSRAIPIVVEQYGEEDVSVWMTLEERHR